MLQHGCVLLPLLLVHQQRVGHTWYSRLYGSQARCFQSGACCCSVLGVRVWLQQVLGVGVGPTHMAVRLLGDVRIQWRTAVEAEAAGARLLVLRLGAAHEDCHWGDSGTLGAIAGGLQRNMTRDEVVSWVEASLPWVLPSCLLAIAKPDGSSIVWFVVSGTKGVLA